MALENPTVPAGKAATHESPPAQIGFFSDKAVSNYAWGTTAIVIGGLVLVASLFLYAAGTAADRRIIIYFPFVGVILIVAGFVIRNFTAARVHAGFTMSGFLVSGPEIRCGECTVERANPNAEQGWGFRIPAWKSVEKQPIDPASPAELLIRLLPAEIKDGFAFDIVEIGIAKGNRSLRSLQKDDGVRFWLMEDDRLRRLPLGDALHGIPELFPRLRALGDAVAPLQAQNVKVQLGITLPRERSDVAMALFGPLGALIAAGLSWKGSKEVKEFIQKGRLFDKSSGEDILAFSERMGWEVTIK